MRTIVLRSLTAIKPYAFYIGFALISLLAFQMFGDIALAQGTIAPGPVEAGGLPGELTQTGSFRELILLILNFFLGFLALLAIIMVIYGGFLYVSSRGEQEQLDQAKKILLYAIIGIVVIVISFALVNTLIGGLTRGSDVSVQ